VILDCTEKTKVVLWIVLAGKCKAADSSSSAQCRGVVRAATGARGFRVRSHGTRLPTTSSSILRHTIEGALQFMSEGNGSANPAGTEDGGIPVLFHGGGACPAAYEKV
jgi:hypothetical protein